MLRILILSAIAFSITADAKTKPTHPAPGESPGFASPQTETSFSPFDPRRLVAPTETSPLKMLDRPTSSTSGRLPKHEISDIEGLPRTPEHRAFQLELQRMLKAMEFADAMAARGEHDRAINFLHEVLPAIQNASLRLFLHGNLAVHLTEAGHLEKAREQLEIARTIDDHVVISAIIGGLYIQEGKADEGITYLENIVDAANLPLEYKLNTLYNLACGYSLSGKIDQAIDRLTWALRLSPELKFAADLDPQLDALRKDPRYLELSELVERAHQIINEGQ